MSRKDKNTIDPLELPFKGQEDSSAIKKINPDTGELVFEEDQGNFSGDKITALLDVKLPIDVLEKRRRKSGMPRKKGQTSFLAVETKVMERKRRLEEQQGHRQLAKVKARDHSDEDVKSSGLEGELANNILQHPDLATQRFDGIDPNLNPEPPLNTDARREFDNERREQEMEKQHRLGLLNAPKFSSTPTPRGP